MELLPFQQGEALTDLFSLVGPIAAIVLVVAVMLWFLAWLARYFEYLKTLESPWMDPPTLDFVRRVLEGVWIAFLAIIVLGIGSTQSDAVRAALVAFVLRVPALFFAVFVLFVAALIVRFLRRFTAYLRGELKAKPRRVAPPQALALTEIVLKYLIYVGALSLAILGGIRLLPAEDQAFIARNVGALPAPDQSAILGILAAIVVILVLDRFVVSIFEDVKGRTRKFSARVLEEFRAIARYAVWVVGAVSLLLVLLGFLVSAEHLVILAIGFVAFLLVAAVVAFDPVRNALAGISLMRADPFDVGDRVRIGDDLVGDIEGMGLSMTQVRTLEGERVTVPNARLLQMSVTNFTRSKPCGVSLDLAVGFEVDLGKVEDLLVRAARETQGIVAEPAPKAYARELEGGAIGYRLVAYAEEPARIEDVRSSLIAGVQERFLDEGIIPTWPAPEGAPRATPSPRTGGGR